MEQEIIKKLNDIAGDLALINAYLIHFMSEGTGKSINKNGIKFFRRLDDFDGRLSVEVLRNRFRGRIHVIGGVEYVACVDEAEVTGVRND